MTPLQKRVAVAQAAVDRFNGKPFAWGTADCRALASFVLREFGWKPPKGGAYRTALGAKKALAKAGYADLSEALDALGLPRIPPAAALPGDILRLEDAHGFGALTVALGNGRVLTFGGGVGAIGQPFMGQPRRDDGTFGREPIAWCVEVRNG